MKNSTIIRHLLITFCTLALTACGGGGSGGAATTGASIRIAVTSPAEADNMETPDKSVVLEGTATGSSDIVSITWVSEGGEAGTASGTSSWKTGGIALEPGPNEITITARDAAGASASRTVTITRESEGTGSATLSWTAPTEREDGAPLTNLAGFRIHYGRMSGIYDYATEVDNPGVTTYLVDGLVAGEWHFVVSAYDSDGVESNFSNEVSRKVQ